jgi:hypothetical protein
MAKLLGKNQQLPVRDFEFQRRCRGRRCGGHGGGTILPTGRCVGFTSYGLDPDRDVTQLLDLSDGHGSIRAIKHSLNETALCVPSAIGKLWHWRKILLNRNFQTEFALSGDFF